MDKWNLWPNLVKHLPLAIAYGSILAMSHFAALVLAIIGVTHLLEVILVVIQAGLGYMPLIARDLLALVALSADRQHPVVTLLARVIVIVVLNVYLVVDVVHVLLL